jgi:hypothetical protein
MRDRPLALQRDTHRPLSDYATSAPSGLVLALWAEEAGRGALHGSASARTMGRVGRAARSRESDRFVDDEGDACTELFRRLRDDGRDSSAATWVATALLRRRLLNGGRRLERRCRTVGSSSRRSKNSAGRGRRVGSAMPPAGLGVPRRRIASRSSTRARSKAWMRTSRPPRRSGRARRADRERVWRLYMTGSALACEDGDISVFQVLGARRRGDHGSRLPWRAKLGRRRLSSAGCGR